MEVRVWATGGKEGAWELEEKEGEEEGKEGEVVRKVNVSHVHQQNQPSLRLRIRRRGCI